MSQVDDFFLRALLSADGYEIARVATSNKNVFASARGYNASDCLCVDGEFDFECLGVPKFERAIVGNSNNFSIIQLQHLIDARVMLLD